MRAAEDAAWENSDDDAPEEAPTGSDDGDDDAPEEAGNAPRTVDEDGFSDEEPDAAANAAAVEYDEPPRARRRTGALRRVEAAAAKRRKLAEPAADFVEVPAEPVVAAPPPQGRILQYAHGTHGAHILLVTQTAYLTAPHKRYIVTAAITATGFCGH